jgi:hypothetical protein
MRSFAARHHSKSGLLQIGDELADFAWHQSPSCRRTGWLGNSHFEMAMDAQKRAVSENQRPSNGEI